ncbi:MAG TPA: hypothetical protein VHV77_15630 [Pirellulales bacterium]|nr:hypothetical protein [Pirellulales bacterium]
MPGINLARAPRQRKFIGFGLISTDRRRVSADPADSSTIGRFLGKSGLWISFLPRRILARRSTFAIRGAPIVVAPLSCTAQKDKLG